MAPRCLRVPARTGALAGVRRQVAAWAKTAGLPDAASRRLVMAVDETLANAIEHGLGAGDRQRVRVCAETAADGLTVAVTYRGPRFDPATAPVPAPGDALHTRAVHGYGLHLIRRLADEVVFAYRAGRGGAPGANEVRLTVRSGRPATPASA